MSQEITATQKIPTSILLGSEYIAEITIINLEMNNGYLKFSQRLPSTFTATEINSKNGKFSFKDGLVKIAWVFPPTEKEFTISYKVTVAKEDSGEKVIKGRVYYFFNTHKKFFQLEPHKVKVTNEAPISEKDTTITMSAGKVIEEPLPPKDPIETSNATDTSKNTATNSAAHVDSAWNAVAIKTEPKPIEALPNKDSSAINSKTYRVQFIAIKEKKFTDIPEIFFIKDENGLTKYFSGNFKAYEEANERKKYMISIGFEDAFIVTFENGKIIKKD